MPLHGMSLTETTPLPLVHVAQEGDALVKQVRGEMESMRAQYQGMVSELQAKLSWYIENQVRSQGPLNSSSHSRYLAHSQHLRLLGCN